MKADKCQPVPLRSLTNTYVTFSIILRVVCSLVYAVTLNCRIIFTMKNCWKNDNNCITRQDMSDIACVFTVLNMRHINK